MSLLSKSEIQFLQGQKKVSKSYEYKLKSILKKKLAKLVDNELPLLSSLSSNLDLTKFGKVNKDYSTKHDLTENSKVKNLDVLPKPVQRSNLSNNTFRSPKPISYHLEPEPPLIKENNHKFYIKTEGKHNRSSNRRAGGLAWLRYRLDMAGVVGSNPTRPM